MAAAAPLRWVDLPDLRERTEVFLDRSHAGAALAAMLRSCDLGESIVLAIPAGGVPVGAAIAEQLHLPLDVAVVSKITPSWNSEVGYGAVAFDGTVRLNEPLVRHMGLSEAETRQGIRLTRAKVLRRVADFRGDRPFPDLARRTAILVDDGLASGWTMLTAVQAVRKQGPARVVIAVPTAHADAARRVAPCVDALYCANLRSATPFAVADAYRTWRDLSEEEIAAILRRFELGPRKA